MTVVCSGKMGYHVVEEKKVGTAGFFPNTTGFRSLLNSDQGFVGDQKELQKALILGSALFIGKLSSLLVELQKHAAEACCHAHLERQSHKQMSHNGNPEHPLLLSRLKPDCSQSPHT